MMPSQQNEPPWLKLVRYSLVAFYLVAGTAHIAFPAPFLAITPAWVPNPKLTIFATGLCELAGAIGLLTQRFRRAAGIALAVYAACVLPANIKHALELAVCDQRLRCGLGLPRDPLVGSTADHLVGPSCKRDFP